MGRGRTFFGVLLSAIYLIWVSLLVLPKLDCLPGMALNEIGDFFAGIFGPLAFLWLVLGYFQQGAELRQNNEALRLQAEELRNSVDQQKELVAATHRQVDAEIENSKFAREQRSKSLRPFFAFSPNGGIHAGPQHDLDFSFSNLGAPVTRIKFNFAGRFQYLSREVGVMNNGDIARFKLQLTDDWGDTAGILNINFEDQDGQQGVASFSMSVTFDKPHPQIYASSLLS